MVSSENRPKDAPPNNAAEAARMESTRMGASEELELPPRHEFAHEKVQLSMDCCPVQRVTYLGGKREQFVARMDKLFGDGNWTIGYIAGGKMLSRDEALNLYERSYVEYFKSNPEFTQRLVREARDVYDTNPSNTQSGLDWHKQEDSHSHLQDIAVRRALKTLGLSFQGEKLLQIRGKESDLPELNPGKVPFIAPELINQYREFLAQWVDKGSVEDFWQNNKFVLLRGESSVIAHLKNEVAVDLAANRAQNWKITGERLRALVMMGEAYPEMVSKYMSNLEDLRTRPVKGVEIPDGYRSTWCVEIQDHLQYVASTRPLSLPQILRITDPLMAGMVAEDPEACSMFLGRTKDPKFINAYFSSLMNHLKDQIWYGKLELFTVLLRSEHSLTAFESDPICRQHVKQSAIMDLPERHIRDKLVKPCNVPDETKERFLAALKSIREDPTL